MKQIIAIIGFLGVFAAQTSISSAAYFSNAPVIRCETQITKTLQIGSENNDVYILQRMLVNAGFLGATPNGYFGYQTAAAVRAFQLHNGIPATSIVGPMTRDAVNERLCDANLVDNTYYNEYSYDTYGYSTGITYVGNIDPYVKVIAPQSSNPTVYTTPQNGSYAAMPIVVADTSSYPSPNSPVNMSSTIGVAGIPSSQIAATSIVYNPSMGYTYGITPQSGSVTVSSPVANSVYNEGDTVFVNWGTYNLQTTSFAILLESNITGQSKTVAVVSGNSYSFVLTKELLDAICSGTCNNNQQGSYKIVITTPTTDIAGITSTLRAAVAPVTIKRPLSVGQVSITTSKTPVNTDEVFKLYINVPTSSSWGIVYPGSYVAKLRAVCPPSVSASIAGVPCGQEFIVPFVNNATQQEIPAKITNPTWYKQDVIFQLTIVNSLGQTIGVGETKVTANGAPFGW